MFCFCNKYFSRFDAFCFDGVFLQNLEVADLRVMTLQFTCYVTMQWNQTIYLVAVTLSGILKAKQKLGMTFNSDKLGGIDFTNCAVPRRDPRPLIF